MSLIFDDFPSRAKAEEFGAAVTRQFGLAATVHDSQEESNTIDPFPWQLDPPIVLVDRHDDLNVEEQVEAFVNRYGGRFRGT